MSQRTKVVGARTPVIWLLIAISLIVIAALAVGGLVIYPQMQKQQAEQTRAAGAEQHYQAGLAFQNVSDWIAAEGEYKQVIVLDAAYKDAQSRLTEVKARLAGSAATATAVAQVAAAAGPTATAAALEAHYQKGLGYVNIGRWQEAKAELEQVFAIDPNYKDVQGKLREIEGVIVNLIPTAKPAPVLTPTSSPEGISLSDFWQVNPADPPNCSPPSPAVVPLRDNAGLYNLALLKQAGSTASSLIAKYPDRHQIQYLNDGWYNNCRSWIPDKMPAWIEVDLGDEFMIEKIVFGSEHTAYYKDRAATYFAVKLATLSQYPNRWQEVLTYNQPDKPIQRTTAFEFKPMSARYVHIEFYASDIDNVRIDEVEIYGKR